MASVVDEQIDLSPDVAEVLSRNGAEEHFLTVTRLVRECFPEVVSLEVILQADPDEESRLQIVLCAWLPESLANDLLHAQLQRYHARFVEGLPLSQCPLFTLITDFVPE